jgi:hypothetical protein
MKKNRDGNQGENTMRAAIFRAQDGAPDRAIPRNLYGTFIEHIETCIYDGIWSERIRDRKFHDPVGTGCSQWTVRGRAEADERLYKSAPHGAKLWGGTVLSQDRLALDRKDYVGYLYAAGAGRLTLTLSAGDASVQVVLDVDSAGMEYSVINVSMLDIGENGIAFLNNPKKEFDK